MPLRVVVVTATPVTAEELAGYAEELADSAMNIEDDVVAERIIRIAARLRTLARQLDAEVAL